ncbi:MULTISPECIES: hypothetical protein [unclassified Arcicella]|uniref:hypothetical protein n=1 Tax=unclassified Arcicella TaxID=2644986 RepID=UPI002860F435|nr:MULTISPECIES: hypothetical protein [unclassified Arcicella]MDR6564933.1 hypothetical protein [Arcicella sp. BE51]MDR6814723.1 hypothetical protein [Arcicella sp. BE140]MDR6826169.1 hypothetical protein [Arcicella sp. BE139]
MSKNRNSYFGSKGGDGTFQTIINNIPECDVFVETHAGFARISEKMNHNGLTLLNDVSCKIVDTLTQRFDGRIIQNDVSARLYQDILCCSNTKKVSELDILFNSSMTKRERNQFLIDTCQGNIILENLPAKEFISKYRRLFEFAKTVIYSDPPYPLLSIKGKSQYEFKMTDQEHYELLEDLDTINCDKMISTYPNHIYDEMLNHFNRIEFYSQTRQGKALEYLYTNFSKPLFLNDYRYIGENYREREAFKKQKDNFLRKFKDMNPYLRNAILEQMSS